MATLLMHTLLALCVWRLALLCKLLHVPGGKGRERWLWQGADSPVAVVQRRTLRGKAASADGNWLWEGLMWATSSQFLLSTTLCSLKCRVPALSCLLWGCSRCSALNIAFCIYCAAASRQVVSSLKCFTGCTQHFCWKKKVCKPT